MTTGQRIKDRRKELGMSAEQLAAILDLSPATIYRYEKGDIEKVSSSILQPLADALCTSPAFLMGWSDDVSPESVQDIEEPSNADRILFNALKGATDAEKLQAAKIIEALRK